ncbi:CAAX farnesyltransferase (FTase) subunit beta [Aspergillus nanangensis]|uniref:CAAX farnesyltransferase (FTase) subunit beta n=1 Tax=Aspergillus nanangensis TaxID=2582783 RepID=A0AAD4CPC0_ASPNN|nr:CAAX farnesyltransferase (FTase) subunit beta [Aspergillus nanangensis]
MPVLAAAGKHRRKVRFPLTNQASTTGKPNCRSSSRNPQATDSTTKPRDHHLLKQTTTTMGEPQAHPGVPALFTEPPAIQDTLITETTELQNDTINKCVPFLKGIHSSQKGPWNQYGVPALTRDEHIGYLYDSLEEYPAAFVSIDASRPWMSYWALAGLSLLGQGVRSFRSRVISTFGAMQNPTGGFGGGHGQISHCASSYAAVLSLAMVGGEEVFQLVDRKAMWQWLGRLKQPDGGFRLFEGGEEDVRGAYCSMVIISLLDLPLTLPPEAEARKYGLDSFTSGLSEYLARCTQGPRLFPPLYTADDKGMQVKHSKVVYPVVPGRKPTVPTLSGKLGGLRDKPGKHVDSYHTCYTLTGLSSAQYSHYYTDTSVSSGEEFASAFSWRCHPTTTEEEGVNVFSEGDRLAAFHPIYVIPHKAAESMRLWFENEPLGF